MILDIKIINNYYQSTIYCQIDIKITENIAGATFGLNVICLWGTNHNGLHKVQSGKEISSPQRHDINSLDVVPECKSSNLGFIFYFILLSP